MLDHHDAIIIGSGPTGGFCAKRLTEAGMNVLVLDAGASRLEQSRSLRLERSSSWVGARNRILRVLRGGKVPD